MAQKTLMLLPPLKQNKESSDNEWRPEKIYPDGSCYTGFWSVKTNKKSGYGVMILADGSIYEGHFEDDKANGLGRVVHAEGDWYEGQWKNDQAEGYGRFI